MRMVGASNSFIRLPFVVEGLILGAGGLIAFFAEWGFIAARKQSGCRLRRSSAHHGIPFSDLISPVLLRLLGIGIAVGVFEE